MRPVCYDVCIALILIAESPKQVINLVIHLGNPGLNDNGFLNNKYLVSENHVTVAAVYEFMT
jgi:hypothetical protein